MTNETFTDFIQLHYVELLAALPAVILLAGLFFTVAIDPYIRKQQKQIMLLLGVLVLSLIAQNITEYILVTGQPNVALRKVVASYGYSVRPVILLLFLHIISPRKHHIWEWALIGINAALHTASVFTPVCFTITENNKYQGSDIWILRYFCMTVSLILLAMLFYQTIRALHPSRRKETWIPIFVTLLILLGVFLDSNVGHLAQPVTFLTIAIVTGCVLYYMRLHFQFVREHELAAQTEQRVQLMLSQIKPHFLYNALGAIEELCGSDPAMAREATIKFSEYLRGNMNAISAEGLIPFEQELSHARLYLELEQLRFEDALQVRYDIECTGFGIPSLTLEPIVENAVRHGIRSKPGGRGTVSISTRETPDSYEIVVRDDGAGFDPDMIPNDGQTHVGIQNVRDRLKSVCGGELLINPVPGNGTAVTIRIPKTGE